MTHNELDLVILGSIMSTTRADDNVVHGWHKPVKRHAETTHAQWMCSMQSNLWLHFWHWDETQD